MARDRSPETGTPQGGKDAAAAQAEGGPRRGARKTAPAGSAKGAGKGAWQPTTKHRMRGFEPAFARMGQQIRQVGESRGFAITRLVTHWSEVVGDDLARCTRPVKVGWTREGMGASLVILVQGAMAPMVEMQRERIRERVNAVYGYNAISRVTLTQTASHGFSEGQAAFAPAPAAPPVDPVREAKIAGEAASRTDGVSDPSLKEALERLARNILSRPDRK